MSCAVAVMRRCCSILIGDSSGARPGPTGTWMLLGLGLGLGASEAEAESDSESGTAAGCVVALWCAS